MAKTNRAPLDDSTKRSVSAEGTDNSVGDSNSEASDEGYRTGGVTASKSDETDERPDSSCTHASSQSGSTESGVDVVAAERSKKPAMSKTVESREQTQKNKPSINSKIPFLGSLRGLGKVSFQQHRNNNDLTGTTDSRPMSRSSSITSETSSVRSSSSFGLHRDAFARHSLRIRGETERMGLSPSSRVSTGQQNTSSSRYNMLTWSSGGRNGKRERPALNPELFVRNRPPMVKEQEGLSSCTSQRSRLGTSAFVNSSKHHPRAASASPESRRRYFGTSISSSSIPSSPEVDLLSSPDFIVTPQAAESSSKMSPLLRSMLKDVEIDNDASILKKMQEIVDQYKARVEIILAHEGKMLNEDWEPIRNKNHQIDDDCRSASTPTSTRLTRRNSFDASLSHTSPRVYPSPRKDITAASTSIPSKIPVPLFYKN